MHAQNTDELRPARPVFTLLHGDAKATFAEHPTEIARRALIAAAEVENDLWRPMLLRAAAALPERGPVEEVA